MVTKGTQNILDYWKRRKELMLKGFGSKCQICGYDRCQKALEFHHLDPNEKEITLSRSIYSWETTKNELKKCICVCSNCHREIHDGLVNVDTKKQYFDDTIVSDYNPRHNLPDEYYDTCPVCCGKKLKSQKACSKKCYGLMNIKVDWYKYDWIYMIDVQHKSMREISRMLGISDTAVRKRYRKLKGL